MDYRPREGVDYIIDLYQVVAVPRDSAPDEIRRTLNAKALEYHPDRLQGLALEFKTRGERMARLLNRARAVLLDAEKRTEYDEILTNWEGPVSTDGTPVIQIDAVIRAEMAMKTPEEIETIFAAQRAQAIGMVRHNPKQQAMLGRMFEAADDADADELREAYDAALLAEDHVLAVEEAERGRLLGLEGNKRHETSLGYAETVQRAIEGARTAQTEEHRRRALGGVSTRLALLTGETQSTETAKDPTPANITLPHYFDAQAQKIADIAAQRETVLEKRLAIFQPTYPIAEVQTEARSHFAIGIRANEEDSRQSWIGFSFDKDTVTLSNIEVPQEIDELLVDEKFEEVYNRGFNILTFTMKDQINLNTLLEEAYNKHLQKYFPGVLD